MRSKLIAQTNFLKQVCCGVLLSACAVSSGTNAAAAAPNWKPEKNVELIAGSPPGGGVDRTVRIMQKIMQDSRLIDVTTSVMNKGGGGGALAWAYLNQHAGDPHYLSIITPSMLTNRITGGSSLTPEDFTLIALLFSEYLGFAVKADSGIATARDLLDQLRKNPASLSIAIGTTFNQVGVAMVAKSAGIDFKKLKIVSFKAGSESIAALLGGHVDIVASSPANLAKLQDAGQIRVVALAAPQRLPGAYANVPLWRELGVDAVATNARGVIGPRGIKEGEAAYWEAIMAKLAQTADWKKSLERFFFTNTYMSGAESKRFWNSQYDEIKVLLTELGLAK
ncbi:tripartite tricarboxylate transporter substrate binding protein [Candidatus Berkelbacteria bacterium]|nr:tripartite tricarboxylate transporter substrate binding protein [Candidatus Berkelbacteria bacterium]